MNRLALGLPIKKVQEFSDVEGEESWGVSFEDFEGEIGPNFFIETDVTGGKKPKFKFSVGVNLGMKIQTESDKSIHLQGELKASVAKTGVSIDGDLVRNFRLLYFFLYF